MHQGSPVENKTSANFRECSAFFEKVLVFNELNAMASNLL
jgi:hypothetical protein